MNNSKRFLRMIVLSVMVALGVVISPILRVEGMCPMAHLINIVCAVALGPWYALLCAVLIGIIRMAVMGIPPIALTGAIFGAFLSGVFYKLSRGKLIFAVLGEIIGTGFIGATLSYPVMTFLWGKEGLSWLFYIPSFICGTLIGGSIAYLLLRKLSNAGLLSVFQAKLGSEIFNDVSGVLGNTLAIAAFGVIAWLILTILVDMFKLSSPIWSLLSYFLPAVFIVSAIVYLIAKKLRKVKSNESKIS